MLGVACLLLLCAVTASSAELKRPDHRSLSILPQNVAIVGGAGTRIQLTCSRSSESTNARVMWAEFASSPNGAIISDGQTITPGHPNAARYEIVHDTDDQFDLVINDLDLADGGQYVCQDTTDGAPSIFRGFAEVVVLAGPPTCTVSNDPGAVFEGSDYTMECQISFQGNIAPKMTWSGPDPFQSYVGSTPTSVSSGIYYTAGRSMEGWSFECLTNFTEFFSNNSNAATNAPDYQSTFTSDPVRVRWYPKNLYIVPVKVQYAVGDNVYCYADANPEATYQWQNTRTGEFISSEFNFTVDDTFTGLTTLMRCIATNTIDGNTAQNNLFVNITVPMFTSPTTTVSTPEPTMPPPQANCDDLSGLWTSYEPPVVACLEVDTTTGYVYGIARNGSDPYFVEVYGYTVMDEYTYSGFCGIWPFSSSAFCFAGECHKCFGDEYLTMNALTRTKSSSPSCGIGSTPIPSQQFTFQRSGPPCRGAVLKVKNPTQVTSKLGVKVADDNVEVLPKTFTKGKSVKI